MSAAVDVATRYFTAWTSRDIETAMQLIGDDFVCDAPAGRIEGREAFRAFLEPFTGILRDARILAAFGDESTAVLVYDTETVPVPSAPAAELLTVIDGRIVADRFIFDRAPFDAARAAAARA